MSYLFVFHYLLYSIKTERQNDWAFTTISGDILCENRAVTDLTRRSPWTTGTESYSHSWSQSNGPFSSPMSDVCKQQKKSVCIHRCTFTDINLVLNPVGSKPHPFIRLTGYSSEFCFCVPQRETQWRVNDVRILIFVQ